MRTSGGSNGVTVYLDGGNDLHTILSKVKTSGGKVILPKTYLSKEAGWIGPLSDTGGKPDRPSAHVTR